METALSFGDRGVEDDTFGEPGRGVSGDCEHESVYACIGACMRVVLDFLKLYVSGNVCCVSSHTLRQSHSSARAATATGTDRQVTLGVKDNQGTEKVRLGLVRS